MDLLSKARQINGMSYKKPVDRLSALKDGGSI